MARARRSLRPGIWILVGLLVGASVPAVAKTQLVRMNNGKVLRVQQVEEDGEWLLVTLTGDHQVGIERSLVASVEDDLGEDNDTGANLNVVTSGRYVPRTTSSARRSVGTSDDDDNADPLAGRRVRASQPQPGTVPGGEANPNLGAEQPSQPQPPGAAIGGRISGQNGATLTPGLGSRRPRVGVPAGAAGRTRPRGNN